MNSILALEQETFSRDMSASTTMGVTLFMGAALCGFWFFDLMQKLRATETTVDELRGKLHETNALQDVYDETLEEHDRRIREKKDYDESDEIEEGLYQGWKGEYKNGTTTVDITLWRKKDATIRSNQQWMAWKGEKDSSVTIRDFYLGNLHPEFHWEVREGDSCYVTEALETFVESWESTIQLEICMTFPSKEDLVAFTEQPSFNGDPTVNSAFKKAVESEDIQWKRILTASS